MNFRILPLLLMLMSFTGADTLKIVDFTTLEKELKASTGTVKLVNFWATWCVPCIKEMPYFTQAQNDFKDDLSFNYVSLDFVKNEEKVKQMIQKKGLQGNFFLLKDDPNVYINKIDKDWEGQIPFTLLVLTDGTYVTHNAPFNSYEELRAFLKPYVKHNR